MDAREVIARAVEEAWDKSPTLPPIQFSAEEVNAIADAALSAYHAHLKAAGMAIVPVEVFANTSPVEIVDDAGWALSLLYGKGSKARDRMRAASDAIRAMIAAAKEQTDG